MGADIADEQIENNGLVFTAKKGGAALFYGPEAHYIQDEMERTVTQDTCQFL